MRAQAQLSKLPNFILRSLQLRWKEKKNSMPVTWGFPTSAQQTFSEQEACFLLSPTQLWWLKFGHYASHIRNDLLLIQVLKTSTLLFQVKFFKHRMSLIFNVDSTVRLKHSRLAWKHCMDLALRIFGYPWLHCSGQ